MRNVIALHLFFLSHRRGKCVLNNIITYFDDEDDDIDKLIIQKQSNSYYKEDNINTNKCCFRCGREGHYISDCYASKHIKGYYLSKT